MGRQTSERKAKVEFLRTIVPETLSSLKKQDIMFVGTVGSIERRGNLFVDYRSPYQCTCTAAWRRVGA